MAETGGTTTVPGVGKVPKKELMIGGVVVGTLIVVYYVRKNKSSSATAATPASQYPPDGTTGNPQDPYSTDPATGQTYGNESVGSGGTFGAFGYSSGSGSGIVGYDSAGNPVYAPGYTPQPAGTTTGPPFPNNSAWSQYVITTMTQGNPNLDPGVLTDAIGLYLSGQPVDTSQQQLIFDAIAIGEDPPVAGPNGYPPKVQLNGNKGGSNPPPPVPPPPPPVQTVVVPDVVGMRVALQAEPKLVAAGLTYHTSPTVDPRSEWKVVSQTPGPGTRVARGSKVDLGITRL